MLKTSHANNAAPVEFQPGKGSWLPLLSSSLNTLQQLGGATEADFLRIGSRMQEACLEATNLAQTARQLVTIAGGDRITAVMEQLRTTLAEMANALDQAQQRSVDNCTRISRVGDVLGQLRQPVEDFQRIAKQLYMFEVLIRIESTYLKEMGAEFVNLATDIRKLSNQIKGKTTAIKSNIEALFTTVSHNSRFFDQEIAQGEERKNQAIANTEQSLSSLEQIHHNYLQSGSVIESVSARNSEDISEIVLSLQMHDTYRQQVEHVAEALEGLLPYFKASDSLHEMQDGQRAEDAILKIGDVCEIQHAQLHYASTSLFDSVETILTKLHNMRSSQREITTDLESGSVGDRRSHSFLDEITANMSSVTNLLQEYGKTTATMDDMIRNVLSTINEITTFVQDVEHFGSEIIQIALNARIKAVCTGQEGAAMSSLSDEVGQLSKEAIQRTELIATALGEIHAITETITRKSGADQAAMLERFNDMQQQLDRLLASLKSVGSEVHTLIARMQVQGATLAKELDQITRSTDVHKRIQRMAAGVLANLEQVFTAARQLYPASEAFKEELHSLASRYTMESERRIHAEIARKHGVTIAISAQPADSTPESASEFGDNVDLF